MKEHYLKVGDILKVIKENKLPDDVAVCYQRIEDWYFNPSTHKFIGGERTLDGWSTIKIKGDTYYNAVRFNEQLDRGKLVNEGKLDPDEVGEYYWHDKYKDDRKYVDLEDESILDQYVKGFCCFYHEEKNILCITAHY
jgi:hypothetical protein